MIQRIQTLILIAVVFLISLLIFLPLAEFSAENATLILKADSLTNVATGDAEVVAWPLFIALIVMVIIPLITIFLFKKRMLQIRLTIFGSVLNALFYILYFYECHVISSELNAAANYKIAPLLIPVFAILLNLFAIRRIGQDEMLIRSLNSNRIR